MTATTERDRQRLIVEEVIALCVDADDHLRVALMRMVQRARTSEEASIIQELLEARQQVRAVQNEVLRLHPDRISAVRPEGQGMEARQGWT